MSLLLSEVFSDAYAKQGFAARELVTRWAEIAGAEIAAHSEPIKLQWPRPVEGQPAVPATLVRAHRCADGWYDVGALFRLATLRKSLPDFCAK